MIRATRHFRVLVDTGPIVALLYPHDAHHFKCVETLRQIQPPLLTTWSVLTEAAWLLRADPAAVSELFRSCSGGLFQLLDFEQEELLEIDNLYQQYLSLRPQLADLTLIQLANREELNTIFTLDRRDFTVYRYQNRLPFHLLPEDA